MKVSRDGQGGEDGGGGGSEGLTATPNWLDCWLDHLRRLFRWEIEFKSLTGKFYAASGWSMSFTDPALEREYTQDRAERSVAIFFVTSTYAAVWISALLSYFKLTGYWSGVSSGAFLIPLPSILYAVGCAWLSRPSNRPCTGRTLAVIERLKLLALFFYCDVAITALNMAISTSLGQATAYLPWIPAISVGTAITARRSAPATVLAYCFTFVVDLVAVTVVHGSTLGALLSGRVPVLLTTGIVIIIYAHQTEMASRTSFLNQREFESWKIRKEELQMGAIIGTGTYGQVYVGTYHGFNVAIKKILAKKTSSTSSSVTNSPTRSSQPPPVPTLKPSPTLGIDAAVTLSLGTLSRNVAGLFASLLRAVQNGRDWRTRRQQQRAELRKQEEMFAEFEGEIRTMLSLRHPNILTFMGACLDKPDMLLITEFCDNGSLFDFLVDPRHKPIDTGLKIEFCIGSANGLRYLHSLSPPILHRDFKSLNILVDVNLTVKICDFGLCACAASALQTRLDKKEKQSRSRSKSIKRNSHDKTNSSQSARTSTNNNSHQSSKPRIDAGKIVGTIPWVAPEIFAHEPHSEQSDIYSLAVVMWEIFAEKHPYMDELQGGKLKVADLITAIVAHDYRPRVRKNLRESGENCTPPTAIELMRACWSAKPKHRPGWTRILSALQQIRDSYCEDSGGTATDATISRPVIHGHARLMSLHAASVAMSTSGALRPESPQLPKAAAGLRTDASLSAVKPTVSDSDPSVVQRSTSSTNNTAAVRQPSPLHRQHSTSEEVEQLQGQSESASQSGTKGEDTDGSSRDFYRSRPIATITVGTTLASAEMSPGDAD